MGKKIRNIIIILFVIWIIIDFTVDKAWGGGVIKGWIFGKDTKEVEI
jgi:hypothetical protein